VADVEGAAVGLFPAPPERGVYNNALLPRGLESARAGGGVIAAVEGAYREAGIDSYAIWALEARGLRFDSATRAMAMSLDELAAPRPRIELGDLGWDGYGEFARIPGLLRGASAAEFNLRVARRRGIGTALTAGRYLEYVPAIG
jgi:hypothetical protein